VFRKFGTKDEAVNKPVYCNNNICLLIKLLNILTHNEHHEVRKCWNSVENILSFHFCETDPSSTKIHYNYASLELCSFTFVPFYNYISYQICQFALKTRQ
jgi:hypothetical protein